MSAPAARRRDASIPFADQFADAVREVRANALASALSATAVMIATLGMLLVASITQGLGRSFERFAFSGGPVLSIASDPRPSLAGLRLQRRDVTVLRNDLTGARRISMIQSLGSQPGTSIHASAALQTVAADESLFQTGRYEVIAGRALVRSDDGEHRAVVVFDRSAAERLGLDVGDIGSRVRLGNTFLQLVGIVTANGLGDSSASDGVAIVPETFAATLDPVGGRALTIEVEVPDAADLAAWQARIGVLLRRQRNMIAARQAGFVITSSERIRAGIRTTTSLISLTATLLVGVSLVVGAVGIANVSLISVRHRYFEIGLRIAVGATRRLIMRQFLLENLIVATLGALSGAGAFVLIAEAANRLLAGLLTLEQSALAIGASLLAAVVVGALAGVAPALRASNMDPAVALRA